VRCASPSSGGRLASARKWLARAIIALAVGSSEAPTGSGIAPASNESEARAVPVANARDGVESVARWPCGQSARRKPGRHRPVTHARETRGGDSRVLTTRMVRTSYRRYASLPVTASLFD
jgi:hypothetical protein